MEGSGGVKLCLTTCQNKKFEHNMTTGYDFAEEEVDGQPVVENVVFSCQQIMDTNDIEGMKAQIQASKDNLVEYQMTMTKVDDPSADVLLKAQLMSANKQIFELIQQAQKENNRTAIFEQLVKVDKEVDTYIEQTMKVKDRELRRELMEKVQECKLRTTQVTSVLRNHLNGVMNNQVIAQLNDCAFKGIRKQGVQKKLDERAMKNESIFKANEQNIKKLTAKLDEAELRAKHKDLITELGDCAMSQCDTMEILKAGDCMCLTLDIKRSEAVISDPTKLVISQIIPQFMSLDSFLDSSIFNLKKHQDAAGGFDLKNQGQLAVGVGRENISGVMPLYLFKEHKEVAKLKQGPLYGFMCTLDPMGFAPSQAFTIPFLVLLKAIDDVAKEPSEARKRVLKLVMDSCVNLVQFN